LALSENQQTGRVRVEANGYDPYDRNISLSANILTIEDIRLIKPLTSTPIILPSLTPSLLPTDTSTIPKSTETFTPEPSSQNLDLAIVDFAFCEVEDIDPATQNSEVKVCTVARTTFLQGTTKINISWKYKGNYVGTYSRLWYTNGELSALPSRSGREWKADGDADSTSLTYQAGLLPGEYSVEFRLDSNSQLIFKASFFVQ
jgi:hypothetical protein